MNIILQDLKNKNIDKFSILTLGNVQEDLKKELNKFILKNYKYNQFYIDDDLNKLINEDNILLLISLGETKVSEILEVKNNLLKLNKTINGIVGVI